MITVNAPSDKLQNNRPACYLPAAVPIAVGFEIRSRRCSRRLEPPKYDVSTEETKDYRLHSLRTAFTVKVRLFSLLINYRFHFLYEYRPFLHYFGVIIT